ncbi:VWA domain-containing protein [Steroidobacter cummioxidans]|uniref:VWA domain-containing protein n=1 Tax=Steroidobacter cummioxidans TaxID=1803913 RepID=UPI000E316D35|nr:VWA domain-containing protein [Steroidobacter cummioxidans]
MARRKTEVFSMSFLDCITCAFGSVVLVYTLINAQGGLRRITEERTSDAEVSQLEEQVLEGDQQLVQLRNSLQKTDAEIVRTEGLAPRVLAQIEHTKLQLADSDKETLAKHDDIERLKADLKSLEEGQRRLEGGARSPGPRGTNIRGFEGEGNRHYLTGLKVRGERILFLVDTSASMLDETLVNVLRLRNMSDAHKRTADKWRRTVAITEWLTAHIPETSKFQVYAFNTHTWPLKKDSAGKWLDGNDADALDAAIKGLHELVPNDGTSLENAFAAISALTPAPDRVILITDGLPTQGSSAPMIRKTIDGDGRYKLFEKAMAKYPRNVPLSVVLLPFEGDPQAASAFWVASRRSGGEFMMPAKDWP